MNSPRHIALASPQACILKWLVKDVQKQPMNKVSPTFEVQIGDTKGQVKICLSNNNDLMQIRLQPIEGLGPKQLADIISDASLVYRFGGNQCKQFDKIQVRASGDGILFDVTRLSFSLVTKEYQEPFEVAVQLNLQPVGVTSRERSVDSHRSQPASETSTELVKIAWKMSDVNELPLIKESPLFSFQLGNIPHQVRLAMDINNDRMQIRMTPLNVDIKKFAQSIAKISMEFHPGNNQPPIKSEEEIEVRKVFTNLIYLTTCRLSFAKITGQYQYPLEVALQLSFHKANSSSNSAKKPIASKTFDWQIVDYDMFPLTKTSPQFRMELNDKSMLNGVQLLLKHHRDQSIKIFMTTETKIKELASTIDRATIKITDANGVETEIQDVRPQLSDDELIAFDWPENHLKFFDLTNGFKSGIRILFVFHRASSDVLIPPTVEAPPPSSVSLFAPNPLPSTLLRQLNKLLVDQTDCDIHFDCQGTRIGGHRPILQTRSPFFKELLLQHTDQSVFPLKSIDAETMADTLQYIYTGTAPRIAFTAERLLSVANLMELPELHGLAQQQLLQKTPGGLPNSSSLESIAKLLDLFEVKNLQPEVGTFIRTHLDELLTNSHFERELKRRPVVCYELLVWMHGASKTPV